MKGSSFFQDNQFLISAFPKTRTETFFEMLPLRKKLRILLLFSTTNICFALIHSIWIIVLQLADYLFYYIQNLLYSKQGFMWQGFNIEKDVFITHSNIYDVASWQK